MISTISKFIRVIGIFTILLFFSIFSLYFYFFQFETLPRRLAPWSSNRVLYFALTLVHIAISFNLIFNYIMCILIEPGGTENLPLESFPKTCQQCRRPKPDRAHHCRLCNKCVLKMDHHCAWINNCVGHFNQRYFLLFLFYSTVAVFFYSFFNLYNRLIIDVESNRPDNTGNAVKYFESQAQHVLSIFSYVLFVMLICFSGWNWYLAASGLTSVEYIQEKSKQYDNGVIGETRLINLAHLEMIFGTPNLMKIFLPSIRKLHNDGVNWHFRNSNYSSQIQNQTEIVVSIGMN